MSAEQTTGDIKLYDKTPPVFAEGYPKAGQHHAPGSKRLSLGGYCHMVKVLKHITLL